MDEVPAKLGGASAAGTSRQPDERGGDQPDKQREHYAPGNESSSSCFWIIHDFSFRFVFGCWFLPPLRFPVAAEIEKRRIAGWRGMNVLWRATRGDVETQKGGLEKQQTNGPA